MFAESMTAARAKKARSVSLAVNDNGELEVTPATELQV
jgi:hypothetical protein